MKLLFALAMIACLNSAAAPPAHRNVGVASWYGNELRGWPMANGKPFDPTALTCASWYHPLGTQLRVTNISNGRIVICTVSDRGPHKRLRRIIDLSRAAFKAIGDLDKGLITVQVERVK